LGGNGFFQAEIYFHRCSNTDELALLNESKFGSPRSSGRAGSSSGSWRRTGRPYAIFQYYSIDISSVKTVQIVFPSLPGAPWRPITLLPVFLPVVREHPPLNQIQLLLDLLFVTVVIHYSGGGVVVLADVPGRDPRIGPRDGGVLDTFAFAWVPLWRTAGFFSSNSTGSSAREHAVRNLSFSRPPYEVTKWAWVTMTNMSVAAIGVYLMKSIRHREEELKKLVIKDN